jgi:hypothetical protein
MERSQPVPEFELSNVFRINPKTAICAGANAISNLALLHVKDTSLPSLREHTRTE